MYLEHLLPASLNVTDKLTTTGIGISIANGAGNTAYIEGPSEIWIDPHPFGVGQTSGSVRIRGDLYVDGTEFIVDVDKIELGDFRYWNCIHSINKAHYWMVPDLVLVLQVIEKDNYLE